MKTGKNIVDLATEIQRQADGKKDYLASTRDIQVMTAGKGVELVVGADLALSIGATAHQQIASEAGIPKPYYDRMLADDPGLLATNVNTWFQRTPKTRMLRTLDGRARALLSDRFRTLDNYDLAEVALPVLSKAGMDIVSTEITESRLYLKAVDRSITQHLPVGRKMGDGTHVGFKIPSGVVMPAVQISNSEIGHGSLSVQSGYLDGGCTNLAWFYKSGTLRKYHVGGRLDVGDEIFKLLSDEAKGATDKAVWLQFRDTLRAALDASTFENRMAVVAATAEDKLEGDVPKIVEVTAKKFGLTDTQRGSVLKHLIQGGDLSRFGLFNSVTRAAEDEADYDEATRLEALGGRLIDLPRGEWQELARAA